MQARELVFGMTAGVALGAAGAFYLLRRSSRAARSGSSASGRVSFAAPLDLGADREGSLLRYTQLQVHRLESPGVPPERVLNSAIRLIAGAAYRAHRASAAAHHETHRRVRGMPYTFPSFCDFAEQTLRLVLQLGILDAESRQLAHELIATLRTAHAELEQRIAGFNPVDLSGEARACHLRQEAARSSSSHTKAKMQSAVRRSLRSRSDSASSDGLGAPDSPSPGAAASFMTVLKEVKSAKQSEDARLAAAEATELARGGRADGAVPYSEQWNTVVWEELDEHVPGAMMPNAFWYQRFMPLLLDALVSGRPGMRIRSEPDLDAWFTQEREAGGFEPYGRDVVEGWPRLDAGKKRVVMHAWEAAREYLWGVDKRRERDEEGARHRCTGHLCAYIPFIDEQLGRGDVEAAAMRLSFPYYPGTATWLLLHAAAEEAAIAGADGSIATAVRGDVTEGARVAQFKKFLGAFALNYPCPYCRHHFNAYVALNAEVSLYPLDYLLLGRVPGEGAVGSSLEDKLAEIKDGASLRLFVWKLHNAVSASIARSEAWFHKQELPLITSRYWPSLDAELARARWLRRAFPPGSREHDLPLRRIERVYAVLKPATQVERLRRQLFESEAAECEKVLAAARPAVDAAADAVVASGLLGQYRLDREYADSEREATRWKYRYRPVSELEDSAVRSGMWTFF